MAAGGRHSADERLAAELAAGKTVRDAAAAVGIAERTAFRRLADPAFKARVRKLRSGLIDAVAGQLAGGMTEAAAVLRSLLSHPDANVRHKAAVKLIELAVKVAELTEVADLREEIEELQARLDRPGGVLTRHGVGGEAHPDAI